MMIFLALTFPFLITLLAFGLLPIRMERFLAPGESLDDLAAGASTARVGGVQLRMLLLAGTLAGLMGWTQWQLARIAQQEGDVLFHSRLSDGISVHLLPNLFVGIVLGALLNFHIAARRGREYVRSLLPVRESGVVSSSLYRQMRWLRPLAIVIALLAVAFNVAASRPFFEVTSGGIRYRGFFDATPTELRMQELRAVTTYERRRTPLGEFRANPYAELVFSGGEVIDVFELVQEEELPALTTVLRRVCPETTVFRRLVAKDE
jgi:hypothetical protein